jgi:hypothetical protein
MRAIKIDVLKQDVYEVEITSNIETIYKHIECECFCQVGRRMPNGDILLVDDNGLLLDNPIGAFDFGSYPQTLSGHGILIGTDAAGETQSAQSKIDWVKAQARFVPTSKLGKPSFTITVAPL